MKEKFLPLCNRNKAHWEALKKKTLLYMFSSKCQFWGAISSAHSQKHTRPIPALSCSLTLRC